MFTTQRDGSWRKCVDYHPLNAVNITKKYQLPFTEEFFDHLNGARVSSKIDDHSGYNQNFVREHDTEKCRLQKKKFYGHLKLCLLANQGPCHVYG
jgi:hypothetical protein